MVDRWLLPFGNNFACYVYVPGKSPPWGVPVDAIEKPRFRRTQFGSTYTVLPTDNVDTIRMAVSNRAPALMRFVRRHGFTDVTGPFPCYVAGTDRQEWRIYFTSSTFG